MKKFEVFLRQQQPQTIVVELHGEINASVEAQLNTAYAEAERLHPQRILLNFSQVDYINSTGIALVVSLLARARATHQQLVACGLSDHYIEIFNITRLSDFLTIYPDEGSALSSGAAQKE